MGERTRTSHALPIDEGYVRPGAPLRSIWGCTRRTVESCDGERVVLRAPNGKLTALPLAAVLRNWGRPNPRLEPDAAAAAEG